MHGLQSSYAKLCLVIFNISSIFNSSIKHWSTVIQPETEEMNIMRSFNNWRRYRSTVAELNVLSNRELNDLGISRSDIPYVARQANKR